MKINLCFLGFHEWVNTSDNMTRHCACCSREQTAYKCGASDTWQWRYSRGEFQNKDDVIFNKGEILHYKGMPFVVDSRIILKGLKSNKDLVRDDKYPGHIETA